MKRLLSIIAMLVIFVCMFNACGSSVEEEGKSELSMFIEVECAASWIVVYHRDTKVMYVVSNGSYNHGAFTMLVDENGLPLIWEA
jgi:hypothetical protein